MEEYDDGLGVARALVWGIPLGLLLWGIIFNVARYAGWL